MRQAFWAAFVILGNSLILSAQKNNIKFTNLNTADGLAQATIYSFIQDHLGLMWIGTADGLNKYDGINFEVYRYSQEDSTSISDNRIRFLYEDSADRLWVGSIGGLDLLDRNNNNFIHYRHDPENPQSLSDNWISDMKEDPNGRIWVATKHPEDQLHLFDPETGNAIRYKNPLSNGLVNNILVDARNQIWLLHEDHSITGFDIETRKFYQIREEVQGEPLCIIEDSRDEIWIGLDEGGLLNYEPGTQQWNRYDKEPENPFSLSNNVVWDIQEEEAGKFWIATNGGLNLLDKASGRFEHHYNNVLDLNTVASNFVLRLYKDRTGRLWIGTTDSGVSLVDDQMQKFQHFSILCDPGQSLSSNVVWSIVEGPEQVLWIGTSQGLNRMDRTTGNFEHFFHDASNSRSLSNNRIWAIISDSNQSYWLGTSGGLNHLQWAPDGRTTFKAYKFNIDDSTSISSNSVRNVLIDHLGNLWAGTTQDGLNLVNRNTGASIRFYNDPTRPGSISSNRIRALLQDRKDRLWVATENGLNLYDYDLRTFRAFRHNEEDEQSLSHSYVRCLAESASGEIWVGTNEGLNKLSENAGESGVDQFSFESMEIDENGYEYRIYTLQVDERNSVWIGTNDGLIRYNPETTEFTRFDSRDGLQANEFNQGASFANERGELFFGGINGFNSFHPEKMETNAHLPPVIFTGLEVLHAKVEVGPDGPLKQHINVAKRVDLDHSENTFSFSFAALDYVSAEKNQYAYRLTPFENEWIHIGNQNSAHYTNIVPGEYTFEVKAANNNGLWNETGAAIAVVIHPAFWQTIWFRMLMILGAILTAIGIYRLRISTLLSSKNQLEEKVRRRTDQLRLQKEELEHALTDLKNTQTKLIQQEKMASLGQLTAGIAHEINNPINFIASSLKALKLDFEEITPLLEKATQLKKGKAPSDQSVNEIQALSANIDAPFLQEEINQLLDSIERGTTRTQNIISSLRTFSRDTKESFIEANINEALESTLIILSNKLKRRITVEKDFAKLPLIKCQVSKINQVFLNIMANAIDSIPGEGTISISTRLENDLVKVIIRDTGMGMDADTQKRVFEPFFTTKEVGKGTGLGLAISYSIIQDHHGKIHIDSEPGKGSQFTIDLPVR